MNNPRPEPASMLEHIRKLAGIPGGRGSCTQGELQAADYVADQMHSIGLSQVNVEPFQGSPSTYRPFALAFGCALLGTALVWAIPGGPGLSAGALLNLLGAWGMLAETDLSPNWTRWGMPSAPSHNTSGLVPSSQGPRQRVVLCAHLDSHRTPIFYSSEGWQKLFSTLVGLAFASMQLAFLAYLVGALLDWGWVIWVGLPAAAVQVFALVLCLQADFTPFSPGANDNASGVAVCLEIAARLHQSPLIHTDVWLAFTGCEETATYGMSAFLNAHASQLGEATQYVILDQVGCGNLEYLSKDGLVIKRPTHPRALELASQVVASLSGIKVKEVVGVAYTDALAATKRGLNALTVVAAPPRGSGESTHWHQLSDTPEYIDPHTLQDAFAFAWGCLQAIDSQASEERNQAGR
jgi:hypothetical protein